MYHFKNYLFILSVLGLSCSTHDLQSSLQHSRSLVVACGIQHAPLHWKLKVLATGPPGSLSCIFLNYGFVWIYAQK